MSKKWFSYNFQRLRRGRLSSRRAKTIRPYSMQVHTTIQNNSFSKVQSKLSARPLSQATMQALVTCNNNKLLCKCPSLSLIESSRNRPLSLDVVYVPNSIVMVLSERSPASVSL